jgi:hypothetical protein
MGMNGQEVPADLAAAHTWQPAYYTPPRSETTYPIAVENTRVEMLNPPRRMPAGTPGL